MVEFQLPFTFSQFPFQTSRNSDSIDAHRHVHGARCDNASNTSARATQEHSIDTPPPSLSCTFPGGKKGERDKLSDPLPLSCPVPPITIIHVPAHLPNNQRTPLSHIQNPPVRAQRYTTTLALPLLPRTVWNRAFTLTLNDAPAIHHSTPSIISWEQQGTPRQKHNASPHTHTHTHLHLHQPQHSTHTITISQPTSPQAPNRTK